MLWTDSYCYQTYFVIETFYCISYGHWYDMSSKKVILTVNAAFKRVIRCVLWELSFVLMKRNGISRVIAPSLFQLFFTFCIMVFVKVLSSKRSPWSVQFLKKDLIFPNCILNCFFWKSLRRYRCLSNGKWSWEIFQSRLFSILRFSTSQTVGLNKIVFRNRSFGRTMEW